MILFFAVINGILIASYLNYRRFVPAPVCLGETEYKVVTEQQSVVTPEHQLYGELYLPQTEEKKLPVVICCHGFGNSYKRCKDDIGMSLAKSGIAAYCFDFYGGGEHTRSGGQMSEMSVFTEKKDLEYVIQKISILENIDPEKIFLLGQSQGGCVAAITAPEFKDCIRGLILYYPAFCIADDAQKQYSSIDEIPEITVHYKHKIGKEYYRDLLDYDIYENIADFDRPVLIMHGIDDKMVPFSYSKHAKEVYKNVSLIPFEGEGHGFSGKGKVKAAKYTYQFLTNFLYQNN